MTGPELLGRTADPLVLDSPPAPIADVVARGPLIEVARDRGVLRVPGVASYAVEVGGAVTTHPEADATTGDLRCFLTGPVRALDLVLHGVLCLRASAVRVRGGAVVVCGIPAAGKSVLTAALAARGHPVLADGVVPVVGSRTGPRIWATADGVQLWPPAAERLRVDGGTPVRPALPKQSYAVGAAERAGTTVPVSQVVVLTVDLTEDRVAVRPAASGAGRVGVLARSLWHADVAQRLDPLGPLATLGAVADRVPVTVLARPRGTWTADELADRVEAMTP